MALIKCNECGKEFSNYASACPKCGCPTEVVLKLKNDINEFASSETRIDTRDEEDIKNNSKITEKDLWFTDSENNKDSVDDSLHVNYKNVKKSTKSNFNLIVIGILALIVFVILFYSSDTKIIGEVKKWENSNGSTIEEQVNRLIQNYNYLEIYGWNTQKVESGVYFVTFSFDTDRVETNGYETIAFEYNRNNRIVKSITNNSGLMNKYRKLGLID